MIYIGNDIIDISRIKKNIDNYGHFFLKKIYSKEEIYYCNNKKYPEIHFSGKFAAKEAVIKSINQYNDDLKFFFKDIEIINDAKSKPSVVINNNNFLQLVNIQISISHTKQFATSVAMLYI